MLLTTDKRFKHYKANEDRIVLKDGLLFRKNYGETGNIKYYQLLIPKQLVDEVLWSLHGEFGKHPRITKTIIAYRQKYYYPNMAKLIRQWVMPCEQCIRESRVDDKLTCPAMQNPNEHITAPEDTMQIDLVPELPPSGGYENIVTAMDVFPRYLIAYPTSNQDAKTIARIIISILTKHACLPTTMISDKGSVFMSQVIKEVAEVLGITLQHATTKDAQTTGMLERTHASLKKTLKIETGERRSMWHKYVNIAVWNYNTSYHTSIGCEPSRVFHGRVPYNVLDLKMGIRSQKIPSPNSQIAKDVLKQTEMIFHAVRKNTMQAYIKYKAYYDKKANASKLKEQQYVYVLQPKANHHGNKFPFTEFGWIGFYIVEKALPNNNYLVRKLGTNKTQVLHRMSLRLITPGQPIPDVQTTSHEWKFDPDVIIKHDDLYARAWESEYETSISDNGQHERDSGNSSEVAMRHDLPNDETCTIPGTKNEDSPEILPHTNEIGDGTDTDHYMEPDAEKNFEPFSPTNINPRSTKHDLRHNPKLNCNDDYRY